MNIAVAILNYNGVQHLQNYLPSVIENSENSTIYVIDNASTDNSIDFLTNYPSVKVICLEKNLGFAGGYNAGLLKVEEEIVVCLNSDVRVSPNWLPPILEQFLDPMIGACQPKIKSDRRPDHFEYAGACGGFIDQLGYPFCRGRLFFEEELDQGQYDQNIECFWAGGACIAVRKTVFFGENGFDERFFAHMEEIDLCWRMQLSGYKITVVTASTVYHLGGGTLNSDSPRKTFLNFRNNLLMLSKNLPLTNRIWLIPTRLLLDGIAGIKFLSSGDLLHTLAVIKAHFSFYGMRIFSRTNQWQPAKRLPLLKLMGVMKLNIIHSFYLKKIRKFSDL